MKSNNKNQQVISSQIYFSVLIASAFIFFFQINSANAQTAIQSNEITTEELDWNVEKTEKNELTQEEKELAEQTELGWQKWDAEHPPENNVVIYEEKTKETAKVKCVVLK